MHDKQFKKLTRPYFPFPTSHGLKKIWKPARFQGSARRSNYFEGWYFKQVDADRLNSLSLIPGISLNKSNPHAFIQVIAGRTGETQYYTYPLSDFSHARDHFAIRIGKSCFSDNGIALDAQQGDQQVKGELRFTGQQYFPVSLRRPGIMGWYRYVPFMECYHGVVSMDHGIAGSLRFNGQAMDFTDGKGYIEKDWGSSMPKSWIWTQCNHFDAERTSLMLSIARIPWIGSSFTGFLGFFLLRGQAFHFATYTGARIKHLEHRGNEVDICIQDKDFFLHILGEKEASAPGGGSLKAPSSGQMERVIHESVNAKLHLVLMNKNRKILFEGSSNPAGLEMVGDTRLLQP